MPATPEGKADDENRAKRARQEPNMGPPLKPAVAPPSPEGTAIVPLFDEFYDDETAAVIKLVGEHCRAADTEIEARLGWLSDKHMHKRIKPLWVKSSCVIEDPNVMFDARVSQQSFYHMNQQLNHLVEESVNQGGAKRTYKKFKHLDLFTKEGHRHTLDSVTLEPVESVAKTSLSTINIFNPTKAYDIRFRAATERKVPTPADPKCTSFLSAVTLIRHKERRSYHLDCFAVDLTTSTEYKPPDSGFTTLDLSQYQPGPVHLEVEVELDLPLFRAERARAAAGTTSRFNQLCRLFMDNVRGIADTASNVRNPTLDPLRPA